MSGSWPMLARTCLGAGLPGALLLGTGLVLLLARGPYTTPASLTLARILREGLELAAAATLLGGAGALALVALVAVLGRLVGRRLGGPSRLALALLAPSIVLGIAAVGLWVNIAVLRYRFAPVSLAVDAAIVLVGIASLGLGARALRPRATRIAERLGAWPVAAGGLALLLAGFLSVSAVPRAEPEPAAALPERRYGPDGSMAPGRRAGAAGNRRNLVLVSLDTLRPDRVGCYGHPRPVSPHLDRLASSGVRMANAYSHSPWTLPSHMTLITGLHPSRHGAFRSPGLAAGIDRLEERELTLAEILAGFGYATAAFTASPLLGRPFGFDQGFQVIDSGPQGGHYEPGQGGLAIRWRQASRWLEGISGTPYFLFLHGYDTHDYAPAPEDRERFVRPYEGFLRSYGPYALHRHILADGFYSLDAADVRYLQDLYDATLAGADRVLGEILRSVDARPDGEDTIIVVTSDHGEEFFEHGGTGHGFTFFEEQLRVPLVLRIPGGRAGRVVHERVGLVDLLPTLLELMGLPAPEGLEGESFVSLLDGRGGRDREILAEASHAGNAAALISGDRKLIRANYLASDPLRWRFLLHGLRQILTPEPDRLFDLRADPGELRSLTGTDPDGARTLSLLLEERRHESRAGAGAGGPEAVPMDEATRERLRTLGYIE